MKLLFFLGLSIRLMLVESPKPVISVNIYRDEEASTAKFWAELSRYRFCFFVFLIPTLSSAIRREGAITDALRAVPHYSAFKLPTLVSETPTKDTKSSKSTIKSQAIESIASKRVWKSLGGGSEILAFRLYSNLTAPFLKKLFKGKSKINFAKSESRLAQPRRGAAPAPRLRSGEIAPPLPGISPGDSAKRTDGPTSLAIAPPVCLPFSRRYNRRPFLFGCTMNLTDAMLVLLLAARIHGTDDGVRAAAKSVVKKIPRSKRDGIYKVIDSKSPLLMVGLIAANLD